MGIRFLYASDQERAQVEGVVERMMIDSPGQILSPRLMDRARKA